MSWLRFAPDSGLFAPHLAIAPPPTRPGLAAPAAPSSSSSSGAGTTGYAFASRFAHVVFREKGAVKSLLAASDRR